MRIYLVGASRDATLVVSSDHLSISTEAQSIGCADSTPRLYRISPGLHASNASPANRPPNVPRQVMSIVAVPHLSIVRPMTVPCPHTCIGRSQSK
jgi:hypothetical protein